MPKSARSTNIVVGTFNSSSGVPVELRGMRLLYSMRDDLDDNYKFLAVDASNQVIKNSAGTDSVHFGFPQYELFVQRGYLDLNEDENVVSVMKSELGYWKAEKEREELERRREISPEEDLPAEPVVEAPEHVKDPSAHLMSYFVTSLILTILVCCGRVFAPTLIEMIKQMIGQG